jgi:hypothetical protein
MRTVRYESALVLPDEIDVRVDLMKKRILENPYEPDKIIGDIENFRGFLIRWFAEKEVF